MKRTGWIYIVLSTFFFCTYSSAQLKSDSLVRFYSKKMEKCIAKDKEVAQSFVLTSEGIHVFCPATDTSEKKYEFTLPWNQRDTFLWLTNKWNAKQVHDYYVNDTKSPLSFIGKEEAKQKDSAMPPAFLRDNILQDTRIAIDPGHIAGELETAKMERKWVDMKGKRKKHMPSDSAQGNEKKIIEGKLTLATALLLKKKLEKRGAVVLLTRDKPNTSAFGVDFKKWKDSLFIPASEAAYRSGKISFEEKIFLRTKASDTEIFRMFFVSEDLRQRAKKINEFQPTMSLVIHYNVDETNYGWNKPSPKNFNMAFVGGSFGEDEIDQPEDRIDVLRLLLSNEIEESESLSGCIVKNLVELTKVPPAAPWDAIYLRESCLSTPTTGVYCRNLALTRQIKGALCYGESLYQDNVKECNLLCKEDILVEGILTCNRVEEVAHAYYEGVLQYLRNRTK